LLGKFCAQADEKKNAPRKRLVHSNLKFRKNGAM